MNLLCKIALKYDTDKCPSWHNGTGHSYTPFYYDLLHDRLVKSVLEIGICSNAVCAGASLRMWAEFFPEAQIYGIDNCPWVMVNENRIHSFFYDQSKESDLDTFLKWAPTFDLIVDDGSHEPADQILTANKLVPKLNVDGLYVIEDIREGEKDNIQSQLKFRSEVVEFGPRADDRLIVIRA